jgi:hypothetical protein
MYWDLRIIRTLKQCLNSQTTAVHSKDSFQPDVFRGFSQPLNQGQLFEISHDRLLSHHFQFPYLIIFSFHLTVRNT